MNGRAIVNAIATGPALGDSATTRERGRTWTIATTNGPVVSAYLPAWAEDDPSESGLPVAQLSAQLDDVCHRTVFAGRCVEVVDGSGPATEAEILQGSIECHPYAEDPEPRVPVANLRIVGDYWITDLDPAGLAVVIALLRSQADRLDRVMAPALVGTREDWAAHHPA